MKKKCKVIIPQTNRTANLCSIIPRNNLFWDSKGIIEPEFTHYQCLYILSDDDVKVGDCVLYTNPNSK